MRTSRLIMPACDAPGYRTPRATARDIEGPIHKAVLRYLRATLPHGWIVHHCANKPRSAAQGAREKAMGAIRGWPDLVIYGRRPAEDYPSAWFIEIKPPRETVPEYQREVHDGLRDIGFPHVRIVRSVEDAQRAVWDWGLLSLDAAVQARSAA